MAHADAPGAQPGLQHAVEGTGAGLVRGGVDAIVEQVERVIRGKTEAIHLAVVCLLAEGHLLIEDVPGVGKTSLAKALARTTGGTWSRIQFTPDLLPSDVTGVSVWNRAHGEFEFRPGGVFANVETQVTEYTQADGFIAATTDGLRRQVDSMEDQIIDMQARLALQRESLLREFIEADLAMSRLKNQASSLAQFGSGLGQV